MKAGKPLSIEMLAKLARKSIDEVLLILWEEDLNDVIDSNSVLVGQRLSLAKAILGFPGASKLKDIGYWQEQFNLEEGRFRDLLLTLNVFMSPRARKVPKGAIKKLNGELLKRQQRLTIRTSIELAPPIEKISDDFVEWKTIGKRDVDVSLLIVDDIINIHYALVHDFSSHIDPISPAGVKDMNLVESAVYRLETNIANSAKYESVEMKAAALLHSLIHNHPFHNGNKRTALVSLLVFLDKNRKILTCLQEDLFRMVLSVAQHRIVKGKFLDLADREVLAIAKWVYDNSRPVRVGDRVLPYRTVKQILLRYGCEIAHSQNGRNIRVTRTLKPNSLFQRKKILIANISVRNAGIDLQVRTVKRLREDLHLNEENGIDSEAFYTDSETPVDEFLVRYQKTLFRLARL